MYQYYQDQIENDISTLISLSEKCEAVTERDLIFRESVFFKIGNLLVLKDFNNTAATLCVLGFLVFAILFGNILYSNVVNLTHKSAQTEKNQFISSWDSPQAKLLQVNRDGLQKEILLRGDKEIILGKDRNCDIILEDKQVSNKQLIIFASANGHHLQNLNNTFEVFVNSKPLINSKELENFDIIKIGEIKFVYIRLG